MGEPMTKKSNLPYLSFSSDRRFGIELELNAFDGKNRPDPGQKPAGIDYVAHVVAKNSTESLLSWQGNLGTANYFSLS